MQNETLEGNALIVGTGSSKIGKSVVDALTDNFRVIATHKSAKAGDMLDILDTVAIAEFVKKYLDTYGKVPLATIFLNSGMMHAGDTIHRGNFFRRANTGDPTINTHLNNILLIEKMKEVGIITLATKIIYNASVQVVDEKQGYEDYAYMKRLVSRLLLGDELLDVTILCPSLVKGTTMEEAFKTQLNKKQENETAFDEYVARTMPYGQPTLQDIDAAVLYILAHREETKGKLVFVDGGSLLQNKKELLEEDFLVYDPKTGSVLPYTA